MAKKVRCNTCGREIKDKHYTNMYDDRIGKIVPVCEDIRCQKPYTKLMRKEA